MSAAAGVSREPLLAPEPSQAHEIDARTSGAHHAEHSHEHGCDTAAIKTVTVGISITVVILAIVISIVVAATPHVDIVSPTACPKLKLAVHDIIHENNAEKSRFGFLFTLPSSGEEEAGHGAQGGHEASATPAGSSHPKSDVHLEEEDVELGKLQTIIERNRNSFFPALGFAPFVTSVATASVLDLPYSVNTSIFGVPAGASGTYNEICIYGRGDSLLTSSKLEAALVHLRDSGASRILHLVVDDSYWTPSSLDPPAFSVSPLQVDSNSVELSVIAGPNKGEFAQIHMNRDFGSTCVNIINNVRTGDPNSTVSITVTSVPSTTIISLSGSIPIGTSVKRTAYILDSSTWLACAIQAKVNQIGMTADNSTVGKCSAHGSLIASITGTTVSGLITAALTQQEVPWAGELHAEMLLRLSGIQYAPSHSPYVTEYGLLVLNEFMTSYAEVAREEWNLHSGSGWDIQTEFVSPAVLVGLVRYLSAPTSHDTPAAEHHPPVATTSPHKKRDTGLPGVPEKEAFFKGMLSVGGVSGALRSRFVGSFLEKRIWAHVVTRQTVNGMVGWYDGHDGPVYFSVHVEHWPTDPQQTQSYVDKLILGTATLCIQ